MIINVNENKVLIGTINFEDNINEYAIESYKNFPNIKGLGKCSIEVYENEGKIPHFHITGKGFTICVCLHTNKYFSHNSGHIQFSNSNQKYELNEWLKLPNIKVAKDFSLKNLSNYKTAIYIWNLLNGNSTYLDVNTKQPDYSKLSEEIQNKRGILDDSMFY